MKRAFVVARRQGPFFLTYALRLLGIIVLIGILIRVLAVASYVMSGTGMLPTVLPGDFVLAVKAGASQSSRGQVVTVACPAEKKICMKRIVGIEGDRIEFVKGELIVNGRTIREKALSPQFVQEADGRRRWVVWNADSIETREPEVVPPGFVFLLNDKRSDQEDSRKWGPLSRQQIQARVRLVWLSLEWTDGERIRSWPRVRWSRMLRSID